MEICEGCGRERDDPTQPPVQERLCEILAKTLADRGIQHAGIQYKRVPGGFRYSFEARTQAEDFGGLFEDRIRDHGATIEGIHHHEARSKTNRKIVVNVSTRRAWHGAMGEVVLLDVTHCPRCQGAHARLAFRSFRGTPGRGVFSHWAVCESSADPIVGSVVNGVLEEVA